MLALFSEKVKEKPKTAEFAHLLVSEQGEIIMANQFLAELAGTIIHKKIAVRDMIGKTVNEVFGMKTGSTFVANFLRRKKPFTGKFMIGNQLFQGVVEEVVEKDNTFYEFFYFPVKAREDSSKHVFLQEIVREMALNKDFSNVDWMWDISDNHCKQLISCLLSHEHSTNPTEYCPYKYSCGFHSVFGWMQLDRRNFYRVKVNFEGELYLKALQDRSVPSHLAKKKIACQALDLSMGGVKLKLKNIHLPEDTEVRMVFEEFEAEGTAVWSKIVGEDSLMGVKFSKLDAEQESLIVKAMTKRRILIDNYGI